MTMRLAVAVGMILVVSPRARTHASEMQAAGFPQGPYQLVESWLRVPPGQTLGTLSGVDVDAKGFVHLFRRCPDICDHPKPGEAPSSIWTFDANGVFVREWGQGIAREAHTIRVDREGFIWTVDSRGHQVKRLRADGSVVLALGRYDVKGEGPDTFNEPTDVAVGPNGDIFITDGYQNQRVVKFDRQGRFLTAWGSKGSGPGQFRLPHTIVQDSRGRLLVGDRCGLAATGCTDNRIQIFDTEGRFLEQWTHLGAGTLYITADDTLYVSGNGRVSVADARTGRVLDTIEKAGGHGLAVDSAGNLYTAGLADRFSRYTRRR